MDFHARLDRALILARVTVVELAGRIGLPVREIRLLGDPPPRYRCEQIVRALDHVVTVEFLLDKI